MRAVCRQKSASSSEQRTFAIKALTSVIIIVKESTMKTLFVLVAVAAVSAQIPPNRGPSNPIVPLTCVDPLEFAADEKSVCWYYQCTPSGIKPRPCALGTHVHSNTRLTRFNPCTERYEIQGMYDCTRITVIDPNCTTTCKNGGTPRSEGSLCWCDCPPAWRGNFDCGMLTMNKTTPTPPANYTCPPVDWCAQALSGGRNPCQNGGTCVNQCTNFICDCPRPYSKDRFCSAFSCSTTNYVCPTGTSCNRGVNGIDEFFMCM